MVLELALFFAVLLAAGLVVVRVGRGMPLLGWVALALLGCGLLYGLGLRRRQVEAADADRAYLDEVLPRPRDDNDYVGSAACRACHPGEHASWHRSYHRTMTQRATPESVQGDFDSVSIRAKGRMYHLTQADGQFFVDMVDPDWEFKKYGGNRAPPRSLAAAPRVKKRVVMLTGSHHYQLCWVPGALPNQLHFVPLVYMLDTKRWVPRDDAFLQPPDSVQNMRMWNETCIECHSTGGQPKAMTVKGNRVTDSRVAELGISCEACHGPGHEHVEKHRAPWVRLAALGDAEPDETIVNPAKLPHDRSTHVCGQCHTIGYIADPQSANDHGFRFRPGDDLTMTKPPLLPYRPESTRLVNEILAQEPEFIKSHYWRDGEVRVAGREFLGLSISPCYTNGDPSDRMSCVSCHSLHDSDPNDQLIPSKIGDESCLQCHEQFRGDASAHTHHAPTSSGSRCMNCHMPHTTYGLLGAIRSHAVSNPSVKTNVVSKRPNACNLCHLDQTLGWTGQHLTKWYGQPKYKLSSELEDTAAGPLWTLKGEAGVRALTAWSFGWGPAQEAAGTAWMAPFLSQLLVDDYAAVRAIAGRSLRTLPGYEAVSYDYVGALSHRVDVRKSVERAWAAEKASRKPNGGLLLDEQGLLQQKRYLHLQKTRDRTKVALSE